MARSCYPTIIPINRVDKVSSPSPSIREQKSLLWVYSADQMAFNAYRSVSPSHLILADSPSTLQDLASQPWPRYPRPNKNLPLSPMRLYMRTGRSTWNHYFDEATLSNYRYVFTNRIRYLILALVSALILISRIEQDSGTITPACHCNQEPSTAYLGYSVDKAILYGYGKSSRFILGVQLTTSDLESGAPPESNVRTFTFSTRNVWHSALPHLQFAAIIIS